MSNVTIKSGIRGISEERRTPRLGKIRLGIQVPNKSGNGTHPEMSPYFVFDEETAAGAALYEKFGRECTEIPVAFPTDAEAEFARRNLEAWGAGTLKCKGNGVDALALVNVAALDAYRKAAKGERLPVPEKVWASTARAGNQAKDAPEPVREVIPCFGMGYDGEPACPLFAAEKCKATMHLQVIVRGFPGLGIFQIDTGSVVNIQRLDDFLAYLGNFTGGRFAMVPLLMRLEPYEMRGRRYYGVNFAVDFAAMQAQGIGALPGVSQMSITERVVRFLPQETAVPADVALLAAGPVDDEPPSDGGMVDVATGEVIDEAPDDEVAALNAPLGEEALNVAAAWLDEAAHAAKCTRADVLEALEADLVMVASDLPRYQATWAGMRPVGDGGATAAKADGPSPDGVKSRPMLVAFARQNFDVKDVADLVERLNLESPADLDAIAEKEGGWADAARFVASMLAPAGVA